MTTIKGKKMTYGASLKYKILYIKKSYTKNHNKIKQSAKEGFCNIYGKE